MDARVTAAPAGLAVPVGAAAVVRAEAAALIAAGWTPTRATDERVWFLAILSSAVDRVRRRAVLAARGEARCATGRV